MPKANAALQALLQATHSPGAFSAWKHEPDSPHALGEAAAGLSEGDAKPRALEKEVRRYFRGFAGSNYASRSMDHFVTLAMTAIRKVAEDLKDDSE